MYSETFVFQSENLNKVGSFQRLVSNILTNFKVPKHVAFIMDGNRRFSREKKMQLREGYVGGGKTIIQVLKATTMLNIQHTSFYAFSIENFKRPKAEVDLLLDLALEFILDIRKNEKMLRDSKIKICFFGNLDLLPIRIQVLIGELHAISATYKSNKNMNIFMAYTSRHELVATVRRLALISNEINVLDNASFENSIDSALYTNECPPPEILVRSSGEIRFSDFMLWQLNHSMLYFIDCNWPEIRFLHIFLMLLNYQFQVNYGNFLESFNYWTQPLKRHHLFINRTLRFVKQQVDKVLTKMRFGKTMQNTQICFENK